MYNCERCNKYVDLTYMVSVVFCLENAKYMLDDRGMRMTLIADKLLSSVNLC